MHNDASIVGQGGAVTLLVSAQVARTAPAELTPEIGDEHDWVLLEVARGSPCRAPGHVLDRRCAPR